MILMSSPISNTVECPIFSSVLTLMFRDIIVFRKIKAVRYKFSNKAGLLESISDSVKWEQVSERQDAVSHVHILRKMLQGCSITRMAGTIFVSPPLHFEYLSIPATNFMLTTQLKYCLLSEEFPYPISVSD